MDINNILSHVDHTLLIQDATLNQIKELCNDAIKYRVASVCIAPSFVKATKDYVGDKMSVCTVIGFPNGYNTTEVKCFETKNAVVNGADEIDMVINIGWVKSGDFDLILNEINAVKNACDGRILKVIIETCLLTNDEKIKLCDIVSKSDADYIKTSTGFSTGGATTDDLRLITDNIYGDLKIKAAGGIATICDAQTFLELGADRLGTSRIVKLLKDTGDNNDKDATY